MQLFETSDLISAAVELLFGTWIGWIILGALGVRVGLNVIEGRSQRATKSRPRRGRRKTSLQREFLALLIGGTLLITLFWVFGGSVSGWLLAVVAAAWAFTGLAWILDRRNRAVEFSDLRTLDEVNTLSPEEFEEFVAQLFRGKGARVKVVGGQGDHGVDIVLTGRDGSRALVQCKRYGRGRWVGEGEIRDLYGTLVADGAASKGYLVTTGFFSRAAREWARGKPLVLIDGPRLLEAVDEIRSE